MDPLSSRMVRAALLWLLAGVAIGGVMLSGHWALWFAPTHAHMLFVGWFLQFAVGIAYWLLPRRRSPQRPLGYNERAAVVAVIALNLGLALRVIGEPLQRAGQGNSLTGGLLTASALLQVGAVLVFVLQLWPRLAARPVRKGSDTAAKASTPQIGS
jgi:hypothetical protein